MKVSRLDRQNPTSIKLRVSNNTRACRRHRYKNKERHYARTVNGSHVTREGWRGHTDFRTLTEDSGHKSQWELGGKHGEEPGGSIEAGADLVLLEVVVEVPVVIMKEPRELVHLDLQGHTHTQRCQETWGRYSARYPTYRKNYYNFKQSIS